MLQDGDYGYFATDCSVDSRTGNLAVANDTAYFGSFPGNVAIYAGAQGSPKFISYNREIPYMSSCAYDDRGNLYVDGEGFNSNAKFAKLNYGDLTFKSFKLEPQPTGEPGPVIWHDDRLDVGAGLAVYEFQDERQIGTRNWGGLNKQRR